MRTHYGERSTAAALGVDRNTNAATAGSGEMQAEEPGGCCQGAGYEGLCHEPYQDFKIPAGPFPEQ
eukprot:12631277-Prorocentrum_lima.AAC.1